MQMAEGKVTKVGILRERVRGPNEMIITTISEAAQYQQQTSTS